MGLEALQLDNLTRIAETARDKYVDFKDKLPGEAGCGLAQEFIAEMLYTQLGRKDFNKYVSSAKIKVKDGRSHFLIVIGGKKPDFSKTFEYGIKLDPTIYQFIDIHPELDLLKRQCVFNEDYPKIYDLDFILEDDIFPTIVEGIKMRLGTWH
jgi:hypothetical protein